MFFQSFFCIFCKKYDEKIFFGFILIISILHLQAQRLWKLQQAYCCSAGNELYVAFGYGNTFGDTNKHLDLVFNYGTFDFTTPNFYLKFSQGRLLLHAY